MAERRFLVGLLFVSMLAACSPVGSATSSVPPSTTLPASPSAVTAAPSMPMPTPTSTPTSAPTSSDAPTSIYVPTPDGRPVHQPTEPPPTPTPAPTASPTPRPTPISTVSIPTRPDTFKPGQIATVTATNGVRMRTKPSTASGSLRYTPLLPKGTDLYVISGPTHASGYHWYEVWPIAFHMSGKLVDAPGTHVSWSPIGWVAAGSRDGEAWLGHRTVTCPPRPRDVAALAALSDLEALACFSGVPITVRARILHCNCSITGPCDVLKPAWLHVTGEFLEIVDSTAREPMSPWELKLPLVLDPKGVHPHTIPVDKVVTVTGVFDHPAAAGCQENVAEDIGLQGSEPVWVPTGSCRSKFVVTSIR
jgi:hypothetical protein